MAVLAAVEAVLASLLDAVSATDPEMSCPEDAAALTVGGYLWKFPSEGSNRSSSASEGWQNAIKGSFGGGVLPPPAPQTRDYPRKCGQCGVCWVSDHENEMLHLHDCAPRKATDIQQEVAKLGIPRRVWCEVDRSLTCLQWRFECEPFAVGGGVHAVNTIEFTSIVEVLELAEPANSFRIQTADGRTLVFQWQSDISDDGVDTEETYVKGTDVGNGAFSEQFALNAHHWCEYLHEFSKYSRDSQRMVSLNPPYRQDASKVDFSKTNEDQTTNATLLQKVTRLLLDEQQKADTNARQRDDIFFQTKLRVLLGHSEQQSHYRELRDEKGNSVLLLALKLTTGMVAVDSISTLLSIGADCNLQNYEEESPLLLVAASGDLTAMRVLLASAEVDVNQACALGVTAFHAAANAGDVQMLQLLCNAGARFEIRDENGWTALHYAAASTVGPEALHFLCELLPDGTIDTQCCKGNTALHVASGCGLAANVLALLQTAANPHVCNTSGESAYHLALRNNHISCAVAINEYQIMHLPDADGVSTSTYKDNAIYKDADVYDSHDWEPGHAEQIGEGAWVEGFTEDGHTYYFNTVTGESSWYDPGQAQQQQQESWQLCGGYEEGGHDNLVENSVLDSTYQTNTLSIDDSSILAEGEGSGHHLPLCMIPMVSPLTLLDDPTAAAKYDSARRRAREQRRRRKEKHN